MKFFLYPAEKPNSSIDQCIQKATSLYQFPNNVFNFSHLVNRSSTITVAFSSDFNLIPMPNQQFNQAIPRSYIQPFTQ
jgi:hypothetical protein